MVLCSCGACDYGWWSPLLFFPLCFLFMDLETKVYISLVFFNFSSGIIASDVCRMKQKVLLYNLSFVVLGGSVDYEKLKI